MVLFAKPGHWSLVGEPSVANQIFHEDTIRNKWALRKDSHFSGNGFLGHLFHIFPIQKNFTFFYWKYPGRRF